MLILQTLLLSLALVTAAPPATASATPSAELRVAQAYPDLPGVKSQEEAEEASRVFCEQSVVKVDGNPTYGPRYQTVNNCRRGDGPVFQSPRTPLSLERQKRGLNY